MFTGIIKGIGNIKKTANGKGIKKVEILAPKAWRFVKGESISVSGICSTVVSASKNTFNVDYMEETLKLTTAKYFKNKDEVNLERSLKVGDSLDGHMVSGHVEGLGEIKKIIVKGNTKVFAISAPKALIKNIHLKGSIALDGVSLTVSKKTNSDFEVSLIPYTLSHTTLGELVVGDKVNIETDRFARPRK